MGEVGIAQMREGLAMFNATGARAEEAVRKVLGENLLRVMGQVESIAREVKP